MEYTSIGHHVCIHGGTIGSNVLVGIGAIILDGAVISDNTIVAAGSLVPPRKVFPPGVMLMGSPAQIIRELNEADLQMIRTNSHNYLGYKKMYLDDGGGFLERLSLKNEV